jgi:hypothetical protein
MKRLFIAGVVSLSAVAFVGAAPASAQGSYVVRGVQIPAAGNVCAYDPLPPAPAGAFATDLTGDLAGCWYITAFNVVRSNPSGTGTATGTEEVHACIDLNHDGVCEPGEPVGKFFTTFIFTGKFADGFAGAMEIHGRCHHPIVGGTGEFANAKGEISFTDNTSVTPVTSPYHGPIQL